MKKTQAKTLRRLWPLAALAVVLGVFFALDLDSYFSFSALGEHRATLLTWVHDNAVLAALTYMAIYAGALIVFPPSGAMLTITGGFLFGSFLAGTYVIFAATLGATLLFIIAKTTVGAFLRERAGPWLQRMEAGFKENELSYLLVLRLIPLFPFWLINIAPAFLGVSLRNYVIGTFVGIIPGTYVYASVGNGLGALLDSGAEPDPGIIFEPAILTPILGLALLALLPVGYKKLKARRA